MLSPCLILTPTGLCFQENLKKKKKASKYDKWWIFTQDFPLCTMQTFIFYSSSGSSFVLFVCGMWWLESEESKPGKWCQYFSNCCAYISVGHAAIHNAWIVNKAGIFDPQLRSIYSKGFSELNTMAACCFSPLSLPGHVIVQYCSYRFTVPFGYWLEWVPLCQWDYSPPKHSNTWVQNQWQGTGETSCVLTASDAIAAVFRLTTLSTAKQGTTQNHTV